MGRHRLRIKTSWKRIIYLGLLVCISICMTVLTILPVDWFTPLSSSDKGDTCLSCPKCHSILPQSRCKKLANAFLRKTFKVKSVREYEKLRQLFVNEFRKDEEMTEKVRRYLSDEFGILVKETLYPIMIINWVKDNGVWGGLIARYIFEELVGFPVTDRPSPTPGLHVKICKEEEGVVNEYCQIPHYAIVGSIFEIINEHAIVWGIGMHTDLSKFPKMREIMTHNQTKTNQIHMVRGPRTRAQLMSVGYKDVPEVYGDPVSLLPLMYYPEVEKVHELCFIPHHTEREAFQDLEMVKNNQAKYIEIQGYTESNLLSFIDLILKCKRIASSALHGLVVGDAYGIPSLWVTAYKEEYVAHHVIKYFDYFESVHRMQDNPVYVKRDETLEEMLTHFFDYKPYIDTDSMLRSCPFCLNPKYCSFWKKRK